MSEFLGIEVMIKGIPWRRYADNNWKYFIDGEWKEVGILHSPNELLEAGFTYGRKLLRWQIDQIENQRS